VYKKKGEVAGCVRRKRDFLSCGVVFWEKGQPPGDGERRKPPKRKEKRRANHGLRGAGGERKKTPEKPTKTTAVLNINQHQKRLIRKREGGNPEAGRGLWVLGTRTPFQDRNRKLGRGGGVFRGEKL